MKKCIHCKFCSDQVGHPYCKRSDYVGTGVAGRYCSDERQDAYFRALWNGTCGRTARYFVRKP